MTTLHDVINKELKHSFYIGVKKNDYNATRVFQLTELLTEMLSDPHTQFRKVWVEVFVVYPQQEALACVQRIFKALKLPIPADLAPVN